MEDIIIVGIILVCLVIGIFYTKNHFKGKGGCCGSGSTYVSKKKLKNVIGKKIVVIEGMTCEHCQSRVERVINDIDGLLCKVNLKKKEAVISMEVEITDQKIKEAIEKAGYTVIEIR